MAGEKGSRLRRAAMTGVLTPGLVLGAVGAAGAGLLPGGILSANVAAQSVIDGGPCTAFGAPAAPAATEMSVADIAEQVNPAVVTIINLQPIGQADMRGFGGIEHLPNLPGMPGIDGQEGAPGIEEGRGGDDIAGSQQSDDAADSDELVPVGAGSGFIIDEEGRVVTNAHVVAGAEALTVALQDGTEVPAEVIGSEPLIDVAVLKLDLPAGQSAPGVAKFGDSSALRAGDEVIAIGTALGAFPNSVSQGTVNATNRPFPNEGGLTTMIQHDAEIWQGNSGGPLLNLQGEVVGINTAGIGSGMFGADTGAADMGFAVEGNTVCAAAAELLANGEIVWPYLGIQAEAGSEGQTVIEVVEDGPSDAAGLEAGDVITALDGEDVGRDTTLLDLLFSRKPGDEVTLTVDRDGATETFEVTLGERPEITQ